MTIGCASRAKHALNARVHFFFFDELAARNLVNANLHLSLKPLVMGKQLRDGFLHKLVRSAAGFGREGVSWASCCSGKCTSIRLQGRAVRMTVSTVGMALNSAVAARVMAYCPQR